MRRILGAFAIAAFPALPAVGTGTAAAGSKGPTWPQITRFVRTALPRLVKEHGYQAELVDETFQGLVSDGSDGSRYSGDQGECGFIYEQSGEIAVQQQAWDDWVPIWQQDAATISIDGKTYDSIPRAFIARLDIAPQAALNPDPPIRWVVALKPAGGAAGAVVEVVGSVCGWLQGGSGVSAELLGCVRGHGWPRPEGRAVC